MNNGIEIPEASFVVCGEFVNYSIGIKSLCHYCDKVICLSYSAMKELPMIFMPVCEDCVDKDNAVYTVPSDFVKRGLYEER